MTAINIHYKTHNDHLNRVKSPPNSNIIESLFCQRVKSVLTGCKTLLAIYPLLQLKTPSRNLFHTILIVINYGPQLLRPVARLYDSMTRYLRVPASLILLMVVQQLVNQIIKSLMDHQNQACETQINIEMRFF